MAPQREQEQQIIEQHFSTHYLDCLDPTQSFQLIINLAQYSPTVYIFQQPQIIAEWVFFFHNKCSKKLVIYVKKNAMLIGRARLRLHQLCGADFCMITVPFSFTTCGTVFV